MRREIEMQEPQPDPVLAAALREAYADTPLSVEQAQALRHRIRAAAEALHAADRATRPAGSTLPSATAPVRARRSYLKGPAWAIPALLAATVAAVLLVRRGDREPASSPAAQPAAAVGFASAEQALTADVSDAEFARVLTREDDPAVLLEIAVAGRPGSPTP